MFRCLSLCLLMVGCGSESKLETKSGSGSVDTGQPTHTDTGTDGHGDDTGAPVDKDPDMGPCEDGGWGGITDPEHSIHISLTARSVEGEWEDVWGSPSNPLTNVSELEAEVDTGLVSDVTVAVAFWTGEHDVDPAVLGRAIGKGLRVEACGEDEVQLVLTSSSEHAGGPLIAIDGDSDGFAGTSATLASLSLSSDEASTLIGVSNVSEATLTNLNLAGAGGGSLLAISESDNVNISGVSLTGGNHSLSISNSSATITGLQVFDSTVAGIWTTGPVSSITMDDILISDTSPGPGMVTGVGGWGMFLEGGAVTGSNISVYESTGVAIMADVDNLSLTNVTISGVTTDENGFFGRGLHVMDSDCDTEATVSLTDITVEQTDDSGVFIQRVNEAKLYGIEISSVHLADVPTFLGGGTAGDGLVYTTRDIEHAASVTSGGFSLHIFDYINVDSPARATIIVDGARTSVDAGTVISGDLADTSDTRAFLQNGASVTGTTIDFTDLGDGSGGSSPYGDGPHCLNLGKPEMTGDPTPSIAMSCVPY